MTKTGKYPNFQKLKKDELWNQAENLTWIPGKIPALIILGDYL